MRKMRVSCRNCWARSISSLGLTAVFVSTGALHLVDPAGIQHYGFPLWSSYLLGGSEIVFGVASLIGFAPVRILLFGIALTGGYLHLSYGETSLLVLPAIPMLLISTLAWADRPQAACSCGIELHRKPFSS